MKPQMPPPRVPPLPVAQLLQKVNPSPVDAYSKEASADQKGDLPLEIVAYAQSIYQKPQPQPGGGGSVALQPGWGGQGK